MADDNRALYEATTSGDLAAELETRGLPKTGTKPELVDRLLEHDTAQPPAESEGTPPADAEGEICGECWPEGWPHLSYTAGCVHGNWTRA